MHTLNFVALESSVEFTLESDWHKSAAIVLVCLVAVYELDNFRFNQSIQMSALHNQAAVSRNERANDEIKRSTFWLRSAAGQQSIERRWFGSAAGWPRTISMVRFNCTAAHLAWQSDKNTTAYSWEPCFGWRKIMRHERHAPLVEVTCSQIKSIASWLSVWKWPIDWYCRDEHLQPKLIYLSGYLWRRWSSSIVFVVFKSPNLPQIIRSRSRRTSSKETPWFANKIDRLIIKPLELFQSLFVSVLLYFCR